MAENYQVKAPPCFQRTLEKALAHYKKDPAGQEELRIYLASIADLFCTYPPKADASARFEPWPKGFTEETQSSWEFWKIRFSMPRLRGAKGQGRLMLLLSRQEKLILLVWLYTHEDFEGRPPEKSLFQYLREALDS